ncbi:MULTISPECIES: PepSY-associated TM helix domain-containing protein [Cupriavidus]
MVTGRLRVVIVKTHLYIGLSLGLLFIMLGLTGTTIAWRDELDALINPELLTATADVPMPLAQATIKAVAGRLEADPRYGRPRMLMLPSSPREVFVAWYPLKGPGGEGRSRQVMVDPVTLAVKGERIWGQPGLSRPLLMPTLFQLHHYLLSGETGRTILGVTGMLVLVLVVAGVLLWLPKPRPRALLRAFRISHGGSWSRFNYSLHRTAGIFAAPVLATMAFSGWYLNLPKWVTPIVASVMTVTPPGKPVSAPAPAGTPLLDITQAVAAARGLYPAAEVTRVSFPRKPGDPFEVRLRQPGEVRRDTGATRLWLDAHTGQRVAVRDPLKAPAGDTFLNWMYPLHTGEAFGLPGRIFISVFGLAPLAFGLTGFLIWWKRRRGHRRHVARTMARAQVGGVRGA